MGIFCLKMSSKTPVSSTLELSTQNNSEFSSCCLWIKNFSEISRNYLPLSSTSQQESLAHFWFHILHICCQLQVGLGGPSMTHDFPRQMLVDFGFPHNATSECCTPLLSISEKGVSKSVTEGSVFKKAKKVWTKCPLTWISYSFKGAHINWPTAYTNDGELFV